ncbi:MAG: 3-dehydroquinate synthase [Tannerella sp.]|jgi:3-dehydroquinate synthase|nr:3-dehydroquinate synthase [Tannerella sp.]
MEQETVIVENLEEELQAFLATLEYDRLFVLTDQNTRAMCYPRIESVPAVQAARLTVIEAGDLHKDLDHAAQVWAVLSGEGASRHSVLVNLGGGMVTDLGGFAAATFKRGIRTVNIPTTLMASVDAAVGGKTGVNFNGLKNEIGVFHPPLCVFIDCRFLRTLDRDNLLSGYAEMMKHALISSPEDCAEVFSFDLGGSPDYSAMNPMVARSVAVKERIVAADPREHGIRKALNFGHTVGHAFESLSFVRQRPMLHGHAVAAGLVCELYLSYKHCGFPSDRLTQIVHYMKEYYPPFFFDCNDYEALFELMLHDKKNSGGIIRFVLLSGIGEIRIDQSVAKERIYESFDFYRECFGI